MADKLKDKLLLPADVRRFADGLVAAAPTFDRARFEAFVLDGAWADRELKQRMRHLALGLGEVLPDFPRGVEVLRAAAEHTGGFLGVVLSEYVQCFGLDDPDRALPALREFTRFGSAEFAVRPFLERYPRRTLAAMLDWTADDNEHVRRLASEGGRPRLPWAPALPAFKADPSPLLPILERLRDDPADYVQRSVGNCLNDIAKDHPDVVLTLAERWLAEGSPRTDRIVKRGCRTLLKAGDPRALVLFGFGDPADLHVEALTLSATERAIGDELRFEFTLVVTGDTPRRVRLEYRVDFVKKRGARSPKVFQIREAELAPGRHAVARKHSLRDLSTRKHHPGEHGLAIVVNGVEQAAAAFTLTRR